MVVGRSPILGKPMAMMLLQKNATVTICHSRTTNLPAIVAQADILVGAVGKPEFIKAHWVKPGAVVVDAERGYIVTNSHVVERADEIKVKPFRLTYTDFFYLGTGVPVSEKWGNLGLAMSSFKVDYQDVDLLKETQVTLAHGFGLYSDYHSRIDFGWSLNMYNVDLGRSVTDYDPGSDAAFGIDEEIVGVAAPMPAQSVSTSTRSASIACWRGSTTSA